MKHILSMLASVEKRKNLLVVNFTKQPQFEDRYKNLLEELKSAVNVVEYAEGWKAVSAALMQETDFNTIIIAEPSICLYRKVWKALKRQIQDSGEIKEKDLPKSDTMLDECLFEGRPPILSFTAYEAVKESYCRNDGNIKQVYMTLRNLISYTHARKTTVICGLDFSTEYESYEDMALFWKAWDRKVKWTSLDMKKKHEKCLGYQGPAFQGGKSDFDDEVKVYSNKPTSVSGELIHFTGSSVVTEVRMARKKLNQGGQLVYIEHSKAGDHGSFKYMATISDFHSAA